eukprot:symbB.v1.2.004561.t1/scaffold239.1/size255824/4
MVRDETFWLKRVVTALEELEGSPYLLSADGKGSVSCWDVSPHLRSNDPLLSFDAHERKISQVLQLRSPRLPQVLEEALWNKTSAAAAATATGGTEVSPKSTKNKIPVQAKSTWRQLLTEKTKKTSWWSGIPSCRSCCCCCCNKGNLPVVHGGPPRSHWLIATGSEDKRLVIWLLREVSSTSPLEAGYPKMEPPANLPSDETTNNELTDCDSLSTFRTALPWSKDSHGKSILMAPQLPQAAVAAQDELDASPRSVRRRSGRSASPTKSGLRGDRTPGRNPKAEKVQTAVRLRPFLTTELIKGSSTLSPNWERQSSSSSSHVISCVEMKPNGHGVVLYDPEKPHQPGREFECTYAFDSSQPQSRDYADQSTIYKCLGADMVMHGTTGYNCCLVAYGQTGTGKTHTVHGDWQSQDQRGLLPRIAEGLFERLARLPRGDTGRVRISYIEVYNDRLRDLFSTTARSEYDGSPRTPRVDPKNFASGGGNRLEVRTHPEVGVYVENLQELPVETFRDVAKHVARGEKAKKVERTTMNDRSSRSHTIFSFKVEVRGGSNAAQHNSLSTMQIVDLAGRENEQTSECKDERFRELRYINRSLFELANCILALCDGNRDHVPFRNSKLTMLLSESLSSNSRTTLLATLTPSTKGFDENILTCRFLESTGGLEMLFLRGDSVESFDGLEPLTLKLDEHSFMCYVPQLFSDSMAAVEFQTLAETLQRVSDTVPSPPKDTSNENDRAQFFASGVFQTEAAEEETFAFRCNPRWCLAGRPLEGENLMQVLRLKQLVEQETLRILEALEGRGDEIDECWKPPLFNSVLVNLYLDGRAQIKWHADDEHCYGPKDQILISSLSLGAARYFEIRRKPRRGDTDRSAQERRRVLLQPGSLLIMTGAMQANWQHSLPADVECTSPRINLTFRRITTQPVVNRFAAAEVAKHLQDEIANLQSTKVEDEILSARLTLLRQFSLVWAEERHGSEEATDEVAVVQGACKQVAQGLTSATQHLGRLEHKNRAASEALREVGSKLSTLQHALRAKGGVMRPASPTTPMMPMGPLRSARSDEGDTLRRSLGLAQTGRRLSEEKVGSLRLLRLNS